MRLLLGDEMGPDAPRRSSPPTYADGMPVTRILRLVAPWLPAVVAVWIFASMAIGRQLGHPAMLLGLLLVLAALAVLPLRPWLSVGGGIAGALVTAFADWGIEFSWFPMLLGFVVASVASALLTPRSARLWAGLAYAFCGGAALSVFSSVAGGSLTWSAIVWLGTLLLWGAAFGVRELVDAVRAERAKETAVARTTVVEAELRDERLRADLTHDFHDVMAHSLAVLAAQAEGLRLSYEQHPERIGPVLTTISDTARLALVEVRQLLERVDDDARRPQPTSIDIPALVDQMRSAGPDVRLVDVGTRGHLGRLADIAAYRIVQESLTNALRHVGSDVAIDVVLAWTGPGLTLTVSSPIRDRAALGDAGRGIAGMHERARLAGGTVEIDASGDRFVVSAHLPYEPVHDGPTPPLGEDRLPTLPLRTARPEPEIAPAPAPVPATGIAPWIVDASRRAEERAAARGSQPTGPIQPMPPAATQPMSQRSGPAAWSTATTVDLGSGIVRGSRGDGHAPNPMARP